MINKDLYIGMPIMFDEPEFMTMPERKEHMHDHMADTQHDHMPEMKHDHMKEMMPQRMSDMMPERMEDRMTESMEERMDAGFDGRMDDMDGRGRTKMMVGMTYVPWQCWGKQYDYADALHCGTIFPELNYPFMGRKVVRK